MKTAVVHPQAGFFNTDAVFFSQVRGHVPDNLVHKPGVDFHRAGRLLHDFLGGGGTVGELQDLRRGGGGFRLGDEGFAGSGVDDRGHLVQDVFLTPLVGLPGRSGGAVFPRNRDVVHRAVHGRIVGNGNQAGALGQTQFRNVLAEVELGRRLAAITALAQIDGVQVQFQDVFFFVILFKFQGPENLPDFPVDIGLFILGHVFQNLLGDGGTAHAAVTARHFQHRAGRALPVHALMAEKPFVLNGNGGLPQVVGNLVEVHKDTVFRAVDALEFHPFAGFLVLIIYEGTEVHGIVLRPDFQGRSQRGLHIFFEKTEHQNSRADSDQEQSPYGEEKTAEDTQKWISAAFSAAGRLFRRLRRSLTIQNLAPPYSWNFAFPVGKTGKSYEIIAIYFIIALSVNTENVGFLRKKVQKTHGFQESGQASSSRRAQDFIFFMNSALAILRHFVYNNLEAAGERNKHPRRREYGGKEVRDERRIWSDFSDGHRRRRK